MATVVINNDQFGAMMYNEQVVTQNILNPAFGIVDIGKNDNVVINGGLTFTKRWQEGLGTWETVTSDAFSATSQTLDQKKSVIMNLMSRIVVEQSKFNAQHTGAKPLEEVFSEQIAKSANKVIQDNLAATIKGAFLASDATNFKTDITGDTVKYPTYDTIVDTIALAYPDKSEDVVKAIIVHADIYAVLLKDTASVLSGGVMADGVYKSGQILSIAGLTVIKNSSIAYKTGTGATAVYMSYLVGAEALTLDYQRSLELDEDKDINKGTHKISADLSYFCGIKNASWKGSAATVPTLAALATGTNWEWNEFDTQEVGIHEIKSLKV